MVLWLEHTWGGGVGAWHGVIGRLCTFNSSQTSPFLPVYLPRRRSDGGHRTTPTAISTD